ncbi:MAG TPA: electron transfer flavoprotein subunit alpha/FixB family protein [Elusimicrobiota bacterium]|jgi:electron transfer flavoprotein alpha subunit|nr:electron transfer flavoprotein subunit alpha/FixB family protein [Elusimicrobiota bacterium]
MANKGILVVAVSQRGALPPATYELVTAGRRLADALKEPLAAVVLSDKAAALAADLASRGVDKVYSVEHASLAGFTEETFAKATALVAQKEGFGKVLLASNVAGRALAARLAVLLKAGLATDVAEIAADGKVTRPFYAGNLLAEVEIKSPAAVLTLAPMSFPRAEPGTAKAEIVPVSFDPGAAKTAFASYLPETTNEIDMGAAERIVSGGRGLGGAEGFKKIFELAHALGAAVGASRAAVDAGWIPYKHQVGLTGRSVRPKLYVAVGISGQIQHLAGMSSSGTVVAINTDKDCPLMQMANISVQGDLNELVPLIIAEVKRRRGAAPVAA